MNEKKHIIFVDGMHCQNCVNKVSGALDRLDVDYEVKLEQGTVIVNGSNDAIRASKIAIQDVGYRVK
ncbi:MAG: heavy-metal-associated domain-containing protein [Erysipelothrix sp.]|nr:heavy-metal-associated domain-containing protein [Erysipelothrix sp.]